MTTRRRSTAGSTASPRARLVLADLEALGLLVEEKKHKLQVPRGDRTGQVIEPYLTDQWFVKMDDLGARGLELVESGNGALRAGELDQHLPPLDGQHPGLVHHRASCGGAIASRPGTTASGEHLRRPQRSRKCARSSGLGADVLLTRDNDVLETWFSSALWSHSTLGWPDEQAMAERGFDRYLPTSVLVTGFDIIFFWVARMIMMTDHFTGQVPFKDVYITGLVRDTRRPEDVQVEGQRARPDRPHRRHHRSTPWSPSAPPA